MSSTFSVFPNAVPRKSYAKISDVLDVPNLVQIQLDSYRQFCDQHPNKDNPEEKGGLRSLFDEISPIQDFTGSRFELFFLSYGFGEQNKAEMPLFKDDDSFWRYIRDAAPAKRSEAECRERDITYAAPLYVRVQLVIKETGEIKEQDIFMGDFPMMTPKGTFVINGAERVVVSQLIRSPGVYFTLEQDMATGRQLCNAKLIPERGAWLEFETSSKDVISVKVDGKRKIPVTTMLRAIGYGSDEELLTLFKEVDADHRFIQATMERDPLVTNTKGALIEFYRRLRPGDPPSMDNAQNLIDNLLFNSRRYNLGKVGRYKLNKRLGLDLSPNEQVLTKEDLVEIVRRIIMVSNGADYPDDIDHLGNRRVRTVGELIRNQFRIGLLRMERVIKERMSIIDPESVTPSALMNVRPVVAATREFFGASQLSQFMDQTNPLADLTHRRRVSALGPGGLSRERAGFEVRDVHHSHYGRICPIETPEGPNIGLIGSLATYSVINEYGLIETPYRRVIQELPNNSPDLVGRTVAEAVLDDKGHSLVKPGTMVTEKIAQRMAQLSARKIRVVPFVSSDVVYFSADEEEQYHIAQANEPLDERNQFTNEKIEVRLGSRFLEQVPEKAEFMDVSPKQIVSVSTSLVPFLEHNDANRALMGSNMQRQSVPLICPETPLIGTGMEAQAAYDSGQVIIAERDGEVTSVTAREIVVRGEKGEEHTYPLMKFARSNQGTCINQRPLVAKGERVSKGQVLADSSSTDHGELALGRNVLCAFMSWEGYNFEDAMVISESLVQEERYTSIHIEKHEIESRDTKLGAEEITRDIPNVGEESLRNLDDDGVVRVGAEVRPGDILVGKITPKGETELSAEEKLLRAIFGDKARDVKDSSLRVPHGEWGKVIDVKEFSRDSLKELSPGVNRLVRVWVAQWRKVSEGDKMSGRHGNKGVIARILPPEDMPFLPDGRPVDFILNPIGVPSRMNLGQVLEAHLGWAAHVLGFKVLSPVFDGADNEAIEDALAQAWIAQRAGALNPDPEEENPFDLERAKAWVEERGYDGARVFSDEYRGEARRACLRLWLEDIGVSGEGLSDEEVMATAKRVSLEKGLPLPTWGKTILYDGRTGEPFDQPVTVGYIYMMKLSHLVEDKAHARSTGSYSLITQQPLGGKAQFGGQRFGEMEVWALEAYGAAHVLQELLTVKSDDVTGRAKTYESIIKGDAIWETGVPESFKVLVKELQSLGLAVEVLNEEEESVALVEDLGGEIPEWQVPRFEGS
ncbi:MAG: DNA-directed RNA polymerase subunit beta [Dehalococcoidia bacterium DG_18]|nr:MAG: DNA-directed RNA polymerase subunit beta [Dehalococcoidia bacterium DG_18]